MEPHLWLMPCFYPEGAAQDWCERHAREHAQSLRIGAPDAALS